MTYTLYPIQEFMPLAFDPVTAVYLPTALQDPCLLGSVLCSTTRRLELTYGHNIPETAVFLSNVLRELRVRVTSGALSDATIGSVTCLLLLEQFTGDEASLQAHLDGMLSMLKARGGAQNTPTELRPKVSRALLCAPLHYLTKPTWPRFARDSVTPLCDSLGIPERIQDPSLAEMLSASGVEDDLACLMWRTQRICDAVNEAIQHRKAVDPFLFDTDTMGLQYDILSSETQSTSDIDHVCRLAAIILTRLLTWRQPFELGRGQQISAALQMRLEQVKQDEVDSTLLLWCMYLGAVSSRFDDDSRGWFRSSLRDCCIQLDIDDYDQAVSKLEQIAWVPVAFEKHAVAVWKELHLDLVFNLKLEEGADGETI
jgi:hypothetical protein